MLKHFRVAEHNFRVDLPEEPSYWKHLSQYEPFEIPRSDESIFTMSLGEVPDIEGLEVLYDQPSEDGETCLKIFSAGDGFVISMSPDHRVPDCGFLWISPDYSQARLRILSKTVRGAVFCINNSLMLSYAFSTATKGTLEMHASMVSNSGRAFLFLARSGTGKSTHSTQWLENIPGTELMNDDNPIVRVWPDGRIIAYGSPWSGKTPCYRNVEAPVGAFVKIRRCPENRITRLSLLESYVEIYSSCSGLKYDSRMSDGLHESMASCVTSVPCYVLDCRPDGEAARVCSSEVLKICRAE